MLLAAVGQGAKPAATPGAPSLAASIDGMAAAMYKPDARAPRKEVQGREDQVG